MLLCWVGSLAVGLRETRLFTETAWASLGEAQTHTAACVCVLVLHVREMESNLCEGSGSLLGSPADLEWELRGVFDIRYQRFSRCDRTATSAHPTLLPGNWPKVEQRRGSRRGRRRPARFQLSFCFKSFMWNFCRFLFQRLRCFLEPSVSDRNSSWALSCSQTNKVNKVTSDLRFAR